MSSISPYKEGICHECRKDGDRSNKSLTWNLCELHFKEKEAVKKANQKPLKSGDLKDGIPNVYTRPIAKRSPKRAKEEREYSVKAKAYKLANPDCAARVKAGCTGGTEDIHHMRGKIGEDLLDEFYWLPVCRVCHSWIELNPLSAKKLGLSVSRLETNAA